MMGLGRPEWLFLHKRVEHVCIWPPGSAGAWAGRVKGRWLEHERPGSSLSFVINIFMSMQTRESANPVAVQLQFSCSLFNRFAHSAGPGVVGKRVEWMTRLWGSRPR